MLHRRVDERCDAVAAEIRVQGHRVDREAERLLAAPPEAATLEARAEMAGPATAMDEATTLTVETTGSRD